MRRAILERFRVEHGEKRIRKLEAERVKRLLATMRPWAQRNWLKTLRGLAAFCLTENLIDTNPTATVKLAKARTREVLSRGRLPQLSDTERVIRSVRVRASRSNCSTARWRRAAIWYGLVRSMLKAE